jgi:hypothetical protein
VAETEWGVLSWPSTPHGETVYLPCPFGSVTSSLFRMRPPTGGDDNTAATDHRDYDYNDNQRVHSSTNGTNARSGNGMSARISARTFKHAVVSRFQVTAATSGAHGDDDDDGVEGVTSSRIRRREAVSPGAGEDDGPAGRNGTGDEGSDFEALSLSMRQGKLVVRPYTIQTDDEDVPQAARTCQLSAAEGRALWRGVSGNNCRAKVRKK